MKQPKALRLADLLDPSKAEISISDVWGAAAELRRLHAENAKLRWALEIIAGKRLCPDGLMGNVDVARTALGETK